MDGRGGGPGCPDPHMARLVETLEPGRVGRPIGLRYLRILDDLIGNGSIYPSFLNDHRSTNLRDGPELYQTFRDKKDSCLEVVFQLS